MRKVFFAMDGVLADFYNSPKLSGGKRGYGNYPEMFEPGFFLDLPPVVGALTAMETILTNTHYEVWILTQPVKESAQSYAEKAQWIMNHLPGLADKIIMTQDKGALARHNDILVDDNADKWKGPWENRGGLFFHFDENIPALENWQAVLDLIMLPPTLYIDKTMDEMDTAIATMKTNSEGK